MTTAIQQQRLRSRLKTAGVCFGALTLVYATSFYTRDWRTVMPHAEQTAAEQHPVRSKVGPRTAEATLTQAPVWRDPEVTGSLPKVAEPVAAPLKAETLTPPVAAAPRAAAAPSQSKAQTPASAQAQGQSARPHVQQKASKPTQVAAAPAERTPTPVASPSGASSAPIQFQLAERGN